MDFPDPLSPAMASVSPRFRVKDSPSTSGFNPASVRTETISP
jgi:hypothetical protein